MGNKWPVEIQNPKQRYSIIDFEILFNHNFNFFLIGSLQSQSKNVSLVSSWLDGPCYTCFVDQSHPVDVILAGGLLYLAHTLPAAIVGWNERVS